MNTLNTLTPCWHMKALLTAKADERLSGLLQHYLNIHLSQCPQCRATLLALEEVRKHLRALRNGSEEEIATLSTERQQQIEAAWQESLRRHKAP